MDLWIYDVIGEDFWGDGVTAKRVRDDLAKAEAGEPITLRVNCPGGTVTDAIAIAELIKRHGGDVSASIDGLAASAATYLIAEIASDVEIARGALYMIHNAWTVTYGNAADHQAEAEVLSMIDESMVTAYAKASGQDADQIREWMATETWLDATKAVEHGFADRISGGEAKAFADLSKFGYRNAPQPEPAGDEQRRRLRSAAGVRARLAKLRQATESATR